MEITYTNSGGEHITLRQRPPFFLSKLDGTGNIAGNIVTFRAPDQDGSFFVSSTLDTRNITIEGAILADTKDEAYLYRKQLLRLFTPKLTGMLTYRDRRVDCVAERVQITVPTRERAPRFFISLLCPSPFFQALDVTREELALWQPLFSFPLEIPQQGIEFGRRQPSQILEVTNAGDAPCGCEILFSALGAVVNPELLNLDTGEYIRVNKAMSAGEMIRVSTHFARKRVSDIIGDSETNAFALLDVNSTFLQLNVGTNPLRYGAAQNIELLEVSLYFSPLFLGV